MARNPARSHQGVAPGAGKRPGARDLETGFTGACGLFSIILKPAPRKAVDALLDTLTLFGMGYSWGGFESLVIPFDCAPYRTATQWAPGGPALRLHIGLENVDDLKADLERGFTAFKRRISSSSTPRIAVTKAKSSRVGNDNTPFTMRRNLLIPFR